MSRDPGDSTTDTGGASFADAAALDACGVIPSGPWSPFTSSTDDG